MTEGDDLVGLAANNNLEKNGPWAALAWLGPAFPSVIVRPIQHSIDPPSSNRVYVGTDAMGAMYSLADVNHSKKKEQ
jgi:hypothetical protein